MTATQLLEIRQCEAHFVFIFTSNATCFDVPRDQQSACRGKEVSLLQGQNRGLVSNAETEIGQIVFVWDTGAPFNAVFTKRTDVDDLGYARGDTLTLKRFSLSGHDFGPEQFEILDWGDLPRFDGFIGYDFF